MRLSTRVHGMLDYLVGALLIVAPWALGFAGGAAAWPPIAVGVASIGYSLFTDYELGLVRRLQMPLHLWLDALAGLALAISPWVLGFDQVAWIPHLVAGLGIVAVAALTQTVPGYERRGAGRAGAA